MTEPIFDPPADPALTPTDPGLVMREGVPVSTRFDDVYFSREDGLAETAHVFLDGCGLPDLWRLGADRGHVCIAETGFGTGLNFLATWNLWRDTRPPGRVLHYVAVEGYPLDRAQLAQSLAAFPRLSPLAHRFSDAYPSPITPGFHRFWFDDDRVCLTLLVGEAEAVLGELEARVDAWFLDGFSPAKNPSMWRKEVLLQIARLSAPGTRIASFTAAGAVRRGLAEVGFEIAKRPGFGRKRDCIAGRFAGPAAAVGAEPWYAAPPLARRPDRVAVVGAGIAGAAVIGALSRRGVNVGWIDRHGGIAVEASGNPRGLLMARPTADGDVQGAVSAAAFRYALAQARNVGVPLEGSGVLELAGDPATLARYRRMEEGGLLTPISATLTDPKAASDVAGVPIDVPALWHRTGGWIDPPAWSTGLAGGAAPTHSEVTAVAPNEAGWTLSDAEGQTIMRADSVVLASAMLSPALAPVANLPLEAIRGQITRIAETAESRRLRACIAFGGYLTPAAGGVHVSGATYTRGGFHAGQWPVAVQAEDDARTLGLFPSALTSLFGPTPRIVGARAAIRAVTPDRQPIAGPLCDAVAVAEAYGHLRYDAKRREGPPPPFLPGLFAVTGLGSRGLVTAPLMAELAVSQMLGEPWPISRTMAAAVHPNRFTIRDLKRRRL